ncbi:MAG: hypothetical protein ACYTET_05300 [Planctomycetota bacterium]|jgi:hypothetical protein
MAMMNFSEDEVATLHDAVKSCLGELRTEISYTDDRDFKAALRRRQEILQSVMDKLASEVIQLA